MTKKSPSKSPKKSETLGKKKSRKTAARTSGTPSTNPEDNSLEKETAAEESEDTLNNEMDDFNKLLDEFLKYELEASEEEVSNSKATSSHQAQDQTQTQTQDQAQDNSTPPPVKVQSVKLEAVYKKSSEFDREGTCFRSGNFDMIFAYFELNLDCEFNISDYSIELVDSGGNSVPSNILCSTHNRTGVQGAMLFDEEENENLQEGMYHIHFYYKKRKIHTCNFEVIDVVVPYTKMIEILGFGFYRINVGSEYLSDVDVYNGGSHSCFDSVDLSGVMSALTYKNILDKELKSELGIKLYNQLGELVYHHVKREDMEAGETLALLERVEGRAWDIGAYRMQIDFFGEVIVDAEFVVGTRNIISTYTKSSIQPNKNSAGKGIIKADENAMFNLDEMIGLASLKKQIKTLVASVELGKHRKIKKLPTKQPQLHFAFMGNPGTGKTTVAKILGKIYKEIGLLSSGHVVCEERSTLMTQNWGSEGELVNKALEKAKGGVLFIDEAYSLVTEHKSDPGVLIISALLSAMSDERNRDIMVIFAGYSAPMEKMLSKNEGLNSRLQRLYFEDFNEKELMQIANLWLKQNDYKLTNEAESKLEMLFSNAYASRNESFGNGRYVYNLFENEIQPRMAIRVVESDMLGDNEALVTIQASDIPNFAQEDQAQEAIDKLNAMVGLSGLKNKIRDHLSYIRYVGARRDNNIYTSLPPLHMVFTGNPGTGKTSVAEYLGEIYKSLGILSVGNVIKVTRADIVDDVIGGTEKKMKELLNASRGNILFIDEAYTLFSGNDERDFGSKATEVLLDALGKEASDMIVIMAGYPNEMSQLLNSNPGLRGRFPYTFDFADYTEDELFEIAYKTFKKNNLNPSEQALDAVKAIIKKECKSKDNNFSNARFVVRLITTKIIPTMARRLEGVTDIEQLCRVEVEDIPIDINEVNMINNNLFDEQAIDLALSELDSMVGLVKVKQSIHQFVEFARVLNTQDPTSIENYPLKWSFVGETGTGKSSVAGILSKILKAMHLLNEGHIVEVKAEELYGVNTYKADELLRSRMKESLQGLLFVDGDAPQFKSVDSKFNPDYLRICLAANTSEIHGRFAVVIAEHNSPHVGLAASLSNIGINNFDHTLIFDDYTPDELLAILTQQLAQLSLTLSIEAAQIMSSYITRLHSDKRSGYANARTMKLLAYTIQKMAIVACAESKVVAGEVVERFAEIKEGRRRVGY